MKQFKTIFFTSLVTALITLTLLAAYNILYSGSTTGAFSTNQTDLDEKIKQVSHQQNLANNTNIIESRHNIITETVKKVSPAVVGINVTEIRTFRDPLSNLFGNDPFFQRFFGNRTHKQSVKGLGSGAIISSDGYIITNDHVAGNAVEIIVTLTDGTQYPAEIVGTDHVSDICLLKIDSEISLPHIDLGNSDEIMIGEWVIALGNPFGLFQINDKPTVTVGVISSQNMNIGEVNQRYYIDMLQTDASINGGNSGGPLVNSIGELIGMNTLIYSPGGNNGSVGVGFAIPINKVKRIITELKENGKIDRDFWVGFNIQSIDEGIAKYYELPSQRGVIVTFVEKSSPATRAGLKVGDIIVEANNFRINDDNTFIGVIQEYHPGDILNMKVIREKEELDIELKLEKR